MVPRGVSSMMRSATVLMNSWSCEANRMLPLNEIRLLLNACIDSKAQAVANCHVHLLVILLGKYAGKATTIKKEKRRMAFCFSQHR